MYRSTLKNRVVSGIVCFSLAAIGVLQSGGESPVIHDGNAPRSTAAQAQHLDTLKMTNPILSSVDL